MQEPHLIKYTLRTTDPEEISAILLIASSIGFVITLALINWHRVMEAAPVGLKTNHPELFILFLSISIICLCSSITIDHICHQES